MARREIINKLTSDGALFRCQGIIECLEGQIKDSEAVAAIAALKDDGIIILGRKVSSYARAALDILGAEAYEGDDAEVLEFIPELKALTSN